MTFQSEDKAVTRKVLLTLDEDTVEVFRAIGEGNVSLGARRAAKRCSGAGTARSLPSGGGPGGGPGGATAGESAEVLERKNFLRECKKLMTVNRLTYAAGVWSRDGAPVTGIAAKLKLMREHPSLARYEKLVN